MGDIDGDGRLDIVSGSNCCDPTTVHVFRRQLSGRFAPREVIRFERADIEPAARVWANLRGHSRPYLLDWENNGKTRLVIASPLSWTLYVSPGLVTNQSTIELQPYSLPVIPGTFPQHFEFADWDNDGHFDLLMVAQARTVTDGPLFYAVDWYRNSAIQGEPKFGAPTRLLTVPHECDVNGIAVATRTRFNRPNLVSM